MKGVEEKSLPVRRPVIKENGLPIFQKDVWLRLHLLTDMNLSKTNISHLPDAFGCIEGLKSLQLSHNMLSTLPSSISHLRVLQKLSLPFNNLTSLPLSFAELNSLEFLDISHNKVAAPPPCFQVGCIRIIFLDISYNQLEEWNEGPLFAHGLESFNCRHNRLHSNPSWIWGNFCRSLKDLDLSFNSFKNPACMVRSYTLWRTGVSIGLKNLDLSSCGFTSNHIILLHQLKAIRCLTLGNECRDLNGGYLHKKKGGPCDNFIWEISFKSFQSATVLTELYLNGVGLASVPDDIICLEVLEILDCSDNELQWLPDTFSKLKKLRVAIFSHNKLLYLPEDIGCILCLEELWLNHNQVGELPSSFSDLKQLKWLDLYSNSFEDFPSCLEVLLNNLSGLDLEYNFFNLKCVDQHYPYPLKDLRGAICRHPRRVCFWQAGQKPPSQEEHYESEQDEDLESYTSSTSSLNLNKEDPEEEPVQLHEESWELDNDDDYFDPTCMPAKKIDYGPRRALIIHEIVLGPDTFCPSDIHPSPSVRANEKDPLAPDDGQFEDA